jgi:hypothetical protein
MIALSDLVAEKFYWARQRIGTDTERELQIVRVSSIFGSTREFLTTTIVGSDQHYAMEEFDFIRAVTRPDVSASS